jgi:hypothetical protein
LKIIRDDTELCLVWHFHSSDSEGCGLFGLKTGALRAPSVFRKSTSSLSSWLKSKPTKEAAEAGGKLKSAWLATFCWFFCLVYSLIMTMMEAVFNMKVSAVSVGNHTLFKLQGSFV